MYLITACTASTSSVPDALAENGNRLKDTVRGRVPCRADTENRWSSCGISRWKVLAAARIEDRGGIIDLQRSEVRKVYGGLAGELRRSSLRLTLINLRNLSRGGSAGFGDLFIQTVLKHPQLFGCETIDDQSQLCALLVVGSLCLLQDLQALSELFQLLQNLPTGLLEAMQHRQNHLQPLNGILIASSIAFQGCL